MSYQFIHIETYSEAAKKVSSTDGHFNSAAQVLGEALREPEYFKHVEEPGSVYKVGGTMSVRQLQENAPVFWMACAKPSLAKMARHTHVNCAVTPRRCIQKSIRTPCPLPIFCQTRKRMALI